MAHTADTERFKRHLRRQLEFIRHSCDSFDGGFKDEGIRIAVQIRVLLHTTRTSTSLLRHLGAEDVELLTTVGDDVLPSTIHSFRLGIFRFTVGPGGGEAELMPKLDMMGGTRDFAFVAAPRWWGQTVAVSDRTHVTRRDIVLGAANRDGGAHVDPKLTPEYDAVAADGALGVYLIQENPGVPVEDAHLVALRQMGHELLNSPALLSLAT